MQTENQKCREAIQLVEKGYSIIPVRNKKPLINWKEYQDRIAQRSEVEGWWLKWPTADIGIICGKISRNLVVLDIDNIELANRVLASTLIKKTRTVKTPSGGAHLYFFDKTGLVKSKPLIDVGDLKAEGGYVVAPPSNGYSLLTDIIPWERNDVENITQKFCSLRVKEKQIPLVQKATPSETLILEGRRHTTLTSTAGFLRRQGFGEASIVSVLTALNEKDCRPPLLANEIQSIAKSMLRYPSSNAISGTLKNRDVPKWHTAKELSKSKPVQIDWLWYGYLPRGMLTLLSGLPKVGKSTLVAHLLKALLNGNDFLNLPTDF